MTSISLFVVWCAEDDSCLLHCSCGPGVGDEDLGIEHNENLHLDLKRMSL
jgi:hypothetical protein